MADALSPVRKPDRYRPPTWPEVDALRTKLRSQRQAKIDQIWAVKRARRGQWDDILARIPKAYRKMTPDVDMPEIRDMLQRVIGMISKQEPQVQVIPPTGRQEDVRKASKEEARLHALRIEIQDQQDQDIYALGIDSQCAWSESWISVWPDPRRYDYSEGGDTPNYVRGAGESATDYAKRYERLMAEGGIPLFMEVHDPQTVLPYRSGNRYVLVVVETEHLMLDINLGLGYRPLKSGDKTVKWEGMTLSEPYVGGDTGRGTGIVDTNHDNPTATGTSGGAQGNTVKSVVYVDQWTYQRYLDGVLAEQWEHNYGVLPMFPAEGEQTSDTDPAWQSQSIIEAPLAIARQILLFSAVVASNAMQHGFPTPFLKNPEHGLVHPVTGQPLSRTVVLGDLNLLGPQEEIQFPYLAATMMPDFFTHLKSLTGQLERSALSSLANGSSDASGYALAQIRATQHSILAPVYQNASRQWRKICYFYRHIVKTTIPSGIFLRGAVEEVEVDGETVQFRPVLEYAKGDCTEFAIDVKIDEGIVQDELAERKSAIELGQAGYWSPRRVMEKTGVTDPEAEADEIAQWRLLNSPAADQQVLVMGMAIAAERYQATRTDMSSPFMQALAQAQQQMSGAAGMQGPPQPGVAAGPGQFANQGNTPANALPGGKPQQQSPTPATPQQGGPGAGAPPLEQLGVPGVPGGVEGGNPGPFAAAGVH